MFTAHLLWRAKFCKHKWKEGLTLKEMYCRFIKNKKQTKKKTQKKTQPEKKKKEEKYFNRGTEVSSEDRWVWVMYSAI